MSYAEAAAKGPKQSPEEVYLPSRSSYPWNDKTLTSLGVSLNSLDACIISELSFPTLSNVQRQTRAPQPAQVESSEGPASDLIDVDSPHISQVHSDFKEQAQQTSTQAERMAKEAEDQARQTASQTEQKASETAQKGKEKANELSSEADQKSNELSQETSKNLEKAKKVAAEDYDKSKKYASEKYRQGSELASETKDELNIKAKETKDDLNANRDNPVVVGNVIGWTVVGVAIGAGAYNKHVKGELDWGIAGIAAGAVAALAVGDYYLSQWLFKNKYPKK